MSSYFQRIIGPEWKAVFYSKAFRVKSIAAQMQTKEKSEVEMHKVLTAKDLVGLGIGGIIGAGVFVLTGVGAKQAAGPSIIISYLLAAFAAFLAALCYTEFVVDLPIAGGAFNFVSLSFGELAAWFTATNLILEYTLSAAAVGRGWTSYMATLLGMRPEDWRIGSGMIAIDFPALGIIVALGSLLIRGTRDSSRFNAIVTGLNVLCIAFVLLAGFPKVKSRNYHPFFPYGEHGVFMGASMVFFSFIGFDTVATTAEEVENPARDLPLGICGSLAICAALYALMAAVITGMVPYMEIDTDAPFASAFHQVDLGWAAYIVSFGAVSGITTSLLVALLGQSRIYVTLGREGLVPGWLAKVSDRTGTPINATVLTICTAGFFALLIDIEVLASMVSIGTLFVFVFVCAGVIIRRYHDYTPEALTARRAAQGVLGVKGNTRQPGLIGQIMAKPGKSQRPGSDVSPDSLLAPGARSEVAGAAPGIGGGKTNRRGAHSRKPSGELSLGEEEEKGGDPEAGLALPTPYNEDGLHVLSDPHMLTLDRSASPVLYRIGALVFFSGLFSFIYNLKAPWYGWLWPLILAILSGLSFASLPVVYEPPKFKVPGTPFTPALGVLACVHLIGSLGWQAYLRFIVWLAISFVVYWFYGMHRTGDSPSSPPLPNLEMALTSTASRAGGAAPALEDNEPLLTTTGNVLKTAPAPPPAPPPASPALRVADSPSRAAFATPGGATAAATPRAAAAAASLPIQMQSVSSGGVGLAMPAASAAGQGAAGVAVEDIVSPGGGAASVMFPPVRRGKKAAGSGSFGAGSAKQD